MARKAQNHVFQLTLKSVDGRELRTFEVVVSDSTNPDGTAGPLYIQNGESYGIGEDIVNAAALFIANFGPQPEPAPNPLEMV